MQSERSFRYTLVKWEDMTTRTEKLKRLIFFFLFYFPSHSQPPSPPPMSSKPRGGTDWWGWEGEQEKKINYCLNEQLVSLWDFIYILWLALNRPKTFCKSKSPNLACPTCYLEAFFFFVAIGSSPPDGELAMGLNFQKLSAPNPL